MCSSDLNTLSRPELEDKVIRLASHSGGATEAEMKGMIARVWRLRNEPHVRGFVTGG